MNFNKVFFIGALLFCLTLPYGIRFNNLAIAIMALAWLLEGKWKDKLYQLKSVLKISGLVYLYLIYAISLLYSTDLQTGLKGMETKATLMIFPLLLGTSFLTHQQVLTIYRVFVISIFAASMIALGIATFRYFDTDNINVFYYHALSQDTIGLHAIYFANYMALSILILYFDTGVFWSKPVKILLILVFISFILLLSALSILFFLILFSIIEIIRQLHVHFSILKLLGIALLLLLISLFAASVVPYTRQKITKLQDLSYNMDDPDSLWNSITIRMAKWTCATYVISNNPIAGVGIGDEQNELMLGYEHYNFKEGIRCRYNVHNQFLSVWMSVGVIGMIVFLWIFFVALKYGFERQNYLLLYFTLMIILSFATENFLTVQKGVVFFSFFYTLLFQGPSRDYSAKIEE